MEYAFANLLGAPYRGGTLVLHGNELLSPVGNRVSTVELTTGTSAVMPFQNSKQLRTLCLSPDGGMLLAIDEVGRSLLISRRRRVVLHHFSFKGPVAAARFSPDGRFLACAVGKLLQIWVAPGYAKTVAPMQLHHTYGAAHADLTALAWSPDSRWVATASKDLTARVFSVDALPGYQAPILAGHKDTPLGVFFASPKAQEAARAAGHPVPALYTASRDGAFHVWSYTKDKTEEAEAPAGEDEQEEQEDEAEEAPEGQGEEVPRGRRVGTGRKETASRKRRRLAVPQDLSYTGGHWKLEEKHFFRQQGAKLTALDVHSATCLVAAGFSSGAFDILQLPEMTSLGLLSASQQAVSALQWNARGDWLALGCARLGQLLVWEWRSETYVLRQQGHHYATAAAVFSPDGGHIATGADDSKVKLWLVASGSCYVTLGGHKGPVTALAYLPSAAALVSASLDGTVRAWDLVRYRNFRTMTAPEPVQFASLAVDPEGEVVCAGSLDTFQIYVWALRTGKLLDVLAGHEGPVVGLAFSPGQPLLGSASWDKTVRTWDVFRGKGGVETLPHNHDVLALAWRGDGRLLAAATLDGAISLWDPLEAELQGTIEGKRDLRGGRLQGDRRAAGNTAAGAAFTSLAFSADGAFLLAGGASKYVCFYDVEERHLLRRFQLTLNRSLDGVADQLNSKDITDAGPLAQIDDAPSDEDELLPPSTAGGVAGEGELPGTGGRKRPAVRSRAVALSPSGGAWCVATTEGVLLYTLDRGVQFDPTDLAEEVTPQGAEEALTRGDPLRALLFALRLRDAPLMQRCVLSVPAPEVAYLCRSLPAPVLPELLGVLAEQLARSPHVEFLIGWVHAICHAHGPALQAVSASKIGPVLRALQRGVAKLHTDLKGACDPNLHTLEYLCTAAALPPREEGQGPEGAPG